MKRRSFLGGIAAAMCAPFALLKSGEASPMRDGDKPKVARLTGYRFERRVDRKYDQVWLVTEWHDDGSEYQYTVRTFNSHWYFDNHGKRVPPPDPKRSTRRRAR